MARMHPSKRQVTGSALLKVLGAVLLLGALGLLASTENALLAYRQAEQRHGGEVIDMAHQLGPRPGLYGYMVRVAGPIDVVAPPRDVDFNQSAATPVLVRHVEMFQWRELRLGNEITYEQDWVEQPVDSSRFAQPRGHANPGAFPIRGAQFVSGSVQLGGYTLSRALVRALPGSVSLPLNEKAVPANFAATFSGYDNALVTSDQPGHPQVGDLRVSWSGVPAQEVTVIARVDGDHLVAVPNADDGKGYELNVGGSSLLDMRPDMAARPALVWPRRVLALLLAVLGFAVLSLARKDEMPDPLRALGGGALAVGVACGIAWTPGVLWGGLAWYGVALAGAGLAAWRWYLRRR
jgi:hypothetical protein